MTGAPDVVVIGAGIVGAACADALASDGANVLVLESGCTGGGATAAGMGHLVAMDDSDEQFALTRFSLELWDELIPHLPPEAEYERRGTLWIAANADEMALVSAKAAYYLERRVQAEILDEHQLREAEPHLRSGLAGGLRIPNDGVVYAPCVAQWLLQRSSAQRIATRRARVAKIAAGSVTLSDGETIHAGNVVCAAGTAAADLFPGLPVRPRKGHLAITDRYPGFVRHQLVELGYLKSAHGHANESVAFNIQPRATGQMLIGSSRQFGETRAVVDRPVLSRMLERAIEYLPQLAQLLVIRTWTGFRAATDDKLPLIGPVPGRERTFLATGHEGLGITTSLATAALIADAVLGRRSRIAPEPYLPSRFGDMLHGAPASAHA